MNKKSTYLIAAIIFIAVAIGWEIIVSFKPTEQDIKKEEADKKRLNVPDGFKVELNKSETHPSGLRIALTYIDYDHSIKCNTREPNDTRQSRTIELENGFGFYDVHGNSYDCTLKYVNDEYNDKFAIFEIIRGSSYVNEAENENLKKQTEIEEKQKILESKISEFSNQINNAEIEELFMTSNEKSRLNIMFWEKNEWSIQKIEEYKKPSRVDTHDYRETITITYNYKVYVNTSDGLKTYRLNYIVDFYERSGQIQSYPHPPIFEEE